MSSIFWISSLFLALMLIHMPTVIVCPRVKKFIIFTDTENKSTKHVPLDSDSFTPLTLFKHPENQQPVALDYDCVEDRVYWSDIAQGQIISGFFNGTSVKNLFRCNVQTPQGLAIDYVGRNIYWTDAGTNRIEVGLLDGTGRKLLIKDGLDEPRAIVLDVRNGMMYWTDWGANPKIEQAAMDGSARRTIVTGNLVWPNGLTIDRVTNRLFWTDAKLDKIEASDLNGGNRRLVVLSAANIHPYGLAVYLDMLYWTDWNTRSISRFNLSSGSQEIIVNGLQKPMDIHIVDSTLIFSGSHNCSLKNGRCSDFCLLKPGGYQCACPMGIALKSDGKTCDHGMFYKISSDKFLVFAEADFGEIYKVPLEVPETPCYPLGISSNISRPVAVDYDPVIGQMYWADVTLELVARAFPNGSSVQVIAYSNVGTPAGLAVDYVGRNIYWTDERSGRIKVARLDGSSRRSLISNIKKPGAILLNIGESKMYWGDRGVSPKIEQANMDGSARKTLVSSGIMWVNSFTMDYQDRLLYWCDAYLDKIERVDLQGNNRVVILDLSLDSMHPIGLTLFGDALFWSDWNNQSILKYNMTTSVDEVVVHGMGRPMELHVYDQSKFFAGSTSCSQLNGGCSHLCLPNPSGHQCLCPAGLQLKPGDNFTCQEVNETVNRCPQLIAPAQGRLAPCGNLPGHSCTFSCDSGYILTGSANRTCNSNGLWTGTQPQCNDNTPPSFNNTCPVNMVFYATKCSSSALLKWIEPVATDNSGHVSISYPAIRPPVNLSIGLYNVLYSAIDDNENQASCTFIVQVKKRLCPGLQPPIHGSITSLSCGSSFGSQASLSCNTGYQMAGSPLRSCRADGTWSGSEATCNIMAEVYKEASEDEQSNTTLPATATGSLILITLVILICISIFAWKRYFFRINNVESLGQSNSAYVVDTLDEIEELETSSSSNSWSPGLQIENEADQDSPTRSNETLTNHIPTSFPNNITNIEATFTNTGGELCTPLNSDVRITVPSGAIPAGVNQPVFFRVFSEETTLLRDIPKAPDETLISPVVECGPHDIYLLKSVEIIVPHCLCLSEAKKEWITVYRCGRLSAGVEGCLSWERVSNKSEKTSQSKFWFTVEEDSIRIKTKTFSLWSIFACGGPRRKRATIFASRPDPRSDLVYLRFYVYSDNEDSKRRVELKDRERFPESTPAKEKPFRMYNDNTVITVKLTNLEDGWKLDKTNDTQVYNCGRANGNGFRSKDSCDFAVKPEDGRDVNGFSCMVEFQQEGGVDDHKYSIYVNPGFTPLRRQSIRQSPAVGVPSSILRTPGEKEEEEDDDKEVPSRHSQEATTFPDSSPGKGSADCSHLNEMVTQKLCFDISPYVGGNWKRVLRNLSMDETTIRNLDEDFKDCKVADKCYEALLAWKESLGSQRATIKNLCDALRRVGCSEALEWVEQRQYVT